MDPDINAMRADWSEPTRVRFGIGRAAELPSLCAELGLDRPLIVTDPGLAGLSILRQLLEHCRANGVEPGLFHGIRANPTMSQVEAAAAIYEADGYTGVVAFGGGSALDVGKAVALLAGCGNGDPWRFEQRDGTVSSAPPVPPHGIAPPILIAIPTTAGSGAEMRRQATLTDGETGRKRILDHPGLLPHAVIADPVLTIGLPPNLTAATGMNALAHCLEAYVAPAFDPAAEGLAAEGVRLIVRHLAKAVRSGTDLTARGAMMVAAGLGGRVFGKGFGAIQALADPITADCAAHHGLTTAVLMPYVLAFNRPTSEERIARLAAYAGLPGGFDGFLAWVLDLRSEIGIPATLEGLGITPDRIPALATAAAADPFARHNPVPLTEESAAALYRGAIAGTL